MINVQTYVPKDIDSVIKLLWHLEVTDRFTSYQEHIIPDGHPEIIFHLNTNGGSREMTFGKWVTEPAAFISTQGTKVHHLRLEPGARLYGIQFYPHTLSILCDAPLNSFSTETQPISDLRDLAAIAGCISEDINETFNKLELFLKRSLNRKSQKTGFAYVDYAVKQILMTNGQAKLGAIIDKCGVTPKYAIDLFKKNVGLSPKQLSNLVRLNHFIAYRNRHPEKTLTACGYETGYFDQSHLVRSLQQVAGISPASYFNIDRNINNIFSAF